MIVVDTNIICYYYLHTKYSLLVETLYNADSHWISPILWKSEFQNILALYMRKKIINLEKALIIMEEAESFMNNREFEVKSSYVLKIADQSGCSAYDCEYVSLAQDLNVPLITMDKKILKSFPDIAVSLEKFVYEN